MDVFDQILIFRMSILGSEGVGRGRLLSGSLLILPESSLRKCPVLPHFSLSRN